MGTAMLKEKLHTLEQGKLVGTRGVGKSIEWVGQNTMNLFRRKILQGNKLEEAHQNQMA